MPEIEKNIDEELRDFRMKLFGICETTEEERGIDGTSHYAFPEERVIRSAFEKSSNRVKNPEEVYDEDQDFILFPEDPEGNEERVTNRLKNKITSESYLSM